MLLVIPWRPIAEVEVTVEADVPMPGLEQRVRTVVHLATTLIGLQVMLGHMLGADYAVTVRETVADGISVRLTRRVAAP